MSSLQFNSVLLSISNELSPEELQKMKFLCKDKIGKKDREKLDNGFRLFQLLTERRELGEDNTEYLSELLTAIHRNDLCEKLNNYEAEFTDSQPEETERAKLDVAALVIAENLGKPWRKLGRKLGLTDVKLESISRKHPSDLEETVMELLKEWRKSQGAKARVKELIDTLRSCQFNLTADKVEDKLSEPRC
ncbi:hypothetical protein LDENG_00166080 [Lucifuga dentata]|nr:hypothetical protein LDENG_00166080 [Lucifuga dentata]